MFAESLLESGNVHHKGRGWATTLSVSIQALLLAALVALPIFRPDKLLLEPKPITAPIAFGVPDVPRESPQQQTRTSAVPAPREDVFREPREIPASRPTDFVPSDRTDVPPIPCVLNCAGPGAPDGVIGATRPPVNLLPGPTVRPPERVRLSQLQLGQLIHQVQPVFPRNALAIRLEGTVVMRALVDREGHIASLQVLSGHPFFINAARDAVNQWRYRPYVLNGQPVEVETQITVNFKLNH